jgi:protein SCO1
MGGDRAVAVLRLLILSVMGLIAASVAAGVPARAASSPVTIGGPFTLTAADGRQVTDQTYRGKWLLIYFGYTYCPDTCPTALNEIADALQRLGPDAAKLQPLFITVDPKRDTREVMGQYVASFDSRIVGLTGSPQQIAAVAEKYGVYYAPHKTGPREDDYVLDHSSYIYLMNPQGKFVQGFDADTPGDRIAEQIRKFMAQSSGYHGVPAVPSVYWIGEIGARDLW